jgi:hypothetical protein
MVKENSWPGPVPGPTGCHGASRSVPWLLAIELHSSYPSRRTLEASNHLDLMLLWAWCIWDCLAESDHAAHSESESPP